MSDALFFKLQLFRKWDIKYYCGHPICNRSSFSLFLPILLSFSLHLIAFESLTYQDQSAFNLGDLILRLSWAIKQAINSESNVI